MPCREMEAPHMGPILRRLMLDRRVPPIESKPLELPPRLEKVGGESQYKYTQN